MEIVKRPDVTMMEIIKYDVASVEARIKEYHVAVRKLLFAAMKIQGNQQRLATALGTYSATISACTTGKFRLSSELLERLLVLMNTPDEYANRCRYLRRYIPIRRSHSAEVKDDCIWRDTVSTMAATYDVWEFSNYQHLYAGKPALNMWLRGVKMPPDAQIVHALADVMKLTPEHRDQLVAAWRTALGDNCTEPAPPSEFSVVVAELVAQSGMSRIELAARVGASESSLSSWTTGEVYPTIPNLAKLLAVLKLSGSVKERVKTLYRDSALAKKWHKTVRSQPRKVYD
jgi:DNA-binding transcriptional regulator YiaG